MDCRSVAFSGHAVRRMFERAMTEADILQVIKDGEVIEDYPQDTPYPTSALVPG